MTVNVIRKYLDINLQSQLRATVPLIWYGGQPLVDRNGFADIEKVIKVPLPSLYKSIVIRNNNGYPKDCNTFEFSIDGVEYTSTFNQLIYVGKDGGRYNALGGYLESIKPRKETGNLVQGTPDAPKNMFNFAYAADGRLAFKIDGDDALSIYFVDFNNNTVFIASSFEEFLSMLFSPMHNIKRSFSLF